MKKGLVLEGGAMRGLFTAGIIDVLMEEGIEFDGVIGVSAGACFGCNYKSGQIGRTLRYNLKYCKDPRMAGFRSLLFTGDIYGPNSVTVTFLKNWMYSITRHLSIPLWNSM